MNVGEVRGGIPVLGPIQCEQLQVLALHAHGSLAEARRCSGTLKTPGSLMEDVFEVRITQGQFTACPLQSLLLDTN